MAAEPCKKCKGGSGIDWGSCHMRDRDEDLTGIWGKEEGSVSGMRKGMHGHLVQALKTEA